VVGTEHLVLALVRMVAEGSTAPGVEALRSLLRRTSEGAIRMNVTEAVDPSPEAVTDRGSLTPRMSRILRRAAKLAAENGRNLAGTEYLLLGMFRDSGGVGKRVLGKFGITYLDVCRQLVLLGALPGPLEPDEIDRAYPKRRYGERVIVAKDELSIVLERLPELLPPGASLAFNHLDEDRSYVRISEGLDGAQYVRRALERGAFE
jgi:Clp amino terminal domain, pathogenicity island component